ncbi:MAG: hypothetical protein PVH87_00995 [Desulfobacteraceae bacterium]|jgi:hypothetical protein
MSILLLIIIFSSFSAISGVIVMAAVCVNKGLHVSAPPVKNIQIGNHARVPCGKTGIPEKTQRPEMALNAEFETLIIQGE